MKRDCPKLKRQGDEKRDNSSESANLVQNDNSDCSDGDMLLVSTSQFVDAWILDSGCSYHITPNRKWFTSYRSSNSSSVYLGDDRCCNIVGIGDVRIKMYDDGVGTTSGRTESIGRPHPTSGDPIAIESGGGSHQSSGGSTTDKMQSYNLARDRLRRTNVNPPSRLCYEDMVAFFTPHKGR
ncbi:hypothetical protein Salat_2814200 [Sesamum alatum]|uniref:Retrovirus-related Pol polyprotein from transposon TNT 1-94-like beta-barrel domain-containing protein n=1 Tax=Sesamum alatum TaxID=300844 RepID=A0AAE1XM76_9LAMI|nr:hypothetical protein Salat_2814200 [Sesamum alatum]